MARVKRFIYNSDFMTVARVESKDITFTVPAGKTTYEGTLEYDINIPSQSWARMRVTYTGALAGKQMLVCDASEIYLQSYQNRKRISYYINIYFKKGKLMIDYYATNTTDSSSVLANAQTFTLHIDFLRQPNT